MPSHAWLRYIMPQTVTLNDISYLVSVRWNIHSIHWVAVYSKHIEHVRSYSTDNIRDVMYNLINLLGMLSRETRTIWCLWLRSLFVKQLRNDTKGSDVKRSLLGDVIDFVLNHSFYTTSAVPPVSFLIHPREIKLCGHRQWDRKTQR